MKFFAHHNIPHVLGHTLRAFDDGANEIELFLDRYPPMADDAVWIAWLGEFSEKPIIIGYSSEMLSNKVEREALRESGCSLISLGKSWETLPWPDSAWRLIKYWHDIVTESEKLKRQSVIEVAVRGGLHRQPL